MEVQSINNTRFGAKIKFENKSLKGLPDTRNKEWANTILNKFEAYHPNETILVGTNNHPTLGPVIYAKNMVTGWIFNEKCGYSYDGEIGDTPSFYNLLTNLLNQGLLIHNDFWAKGANGYHEKMPKVNSGAKDTSPILHNIFVEI